ncbi:MAG: enoyl-[acyl-carrier-protein] reductase [Gemmatimonadetes bacterium]|nr:enoyl-[acyl-carrier-protein] reductase [Gemmatimonadota bacterium]|tara:strand:- start:4487 stop:5383 length:897 start_codon:yes stop_codon:yes gene_type:complete
MLPIDLTGKNAFVAGVADDNGYGWAIAKALAQAGAIVRVGTWPPVCKIFTRSMGLGKLNMTLEGGGELQIEKIYPMDAAFDIPEDVPKEVAEDKRYKQFAGYTIQEVADQLKKDLGGDSLDILVHSLANGPEVKKPLVETSRKGYLAAVGSSAYSLVSMVQRFGPFMGDEGAVISLSYLAAEKVIPGYGGGMSSAKAALENDTRTLAYEAGRRWSIRVNTISAGPLSSRAARAIGSIEKMVNYYETHSALSGVNTAPDVANATAFLCSPLAAGITGETLHVDKGYNVMGMTAEDQLGK